MHKTGNAAAIFVWETCSAFLMHSVWILHTHDISKLAKHSRMRCDSCSILQSAKQCSQKNTATHNIISALSYVRHSTISLSLTTIYGHIIFCDRLYMGCYWHHSVYGSCKLNSPASNRGRGCAIPKYNVFKVQRDLTYVIDLYMLFLHSLRHVAFKATSVASTPCTVAHSAWSAPLQSADCDCQQPCICVAPLRSNWYDTRCLKCESDLVAYSRLKWQRYRERPTPYIEQSCCCTATAVIV